MSNHEVDPAPGPYEPSKLPRKKDMSGPDFFALDMRAGIVTRVEDFPEARKPACKVWVDFGPVVGTLATSAQVTNYAAEDLVGRTVVGAINLGIRRVAGFESTFLLLAALEPDGSPRILSPDGPVAPGSAIA